MAQVTIYMTGDDSRWQAVHNRMLADMQKAIDKATKAGQQSKKLSEEELAAIRKKADEERAFQGLQTRAIKIIKDTASAHDKYSVSVKDAVEMRKKGLITQDQYNRKLAQLKQELRDASGETAKLKAAQAEEERAVVKATATVKRYMTTLEKLKAELQDVKQQHEEGRATIDTVRRAQARLNAEIEKTSGDSLDGWVTKLGAVATAYMSIDQAVQLINQSLENQKRLQENTMSADDRLAVAQEGAVKNFAGLSAEDTKKAIETPLQLADELKFKDRAAATDAMGELYSTVNDIQKDRSALRVGMELTQLSPENVGPVSSGVLKVGEAAGVAEMEKASGFMASFGAASPINDPRKQAEALSPVVETSVAQFPTADKQATAITSAAILATMTERGADKEGRESATATITLIGKIKEMFDGLKDPNNADNAKREKEIAKLEKSAVVTEKESQGIKVAQAAVEKATKNFERATPESRDFAKLKLAKETAEVELRDKQRRSTLTPEESARLDALRKERATIAAIKDPGTPEGQIALIQQNPMLRERLFATSFGEQKFKTPMEQLVTAGTDTAKSFEQKRTQQIAFDESLHDETVRRLNEQTTVLAQSQGRRRIQANQNAADYDPIMDAVGTIRTLKEDTLARTRTPFGASMSDNINEMLAEKADSLIYGSAYYGDDPVKAAESARIELNRRTTKLLSPNDWDGVTRTDLQHVETVNKQLEELANVLKTVMAQLTGNQQARAKQAIQRIEQTSITAAARIQAAQVGR